MATRVVPYARYIANAAGENVRLTRLTDVGPDGLIAELHIQPAAGNYSYMSVYDVASGIVLRDLFAPPVNGKGESWSVVSGSSGDGIDPTQYGVTFAHAGDAWNVYAVVR